MSAGLPAFGLGGMFYLLLIVWMVLRELARKCTGDNSCPSRWAFIGKMLDIGIVMVVAGLGETLIIRGALDLGVAFMPALGKFVYTSSVSFALFMVAIPFIILMLLILGLDFIRLLMNRRRKLVDAAAFVGQ
jgi:hypothetical protein